MAKKKTTKAKEYTPTKEVVNHIEKELGISRPGTDKEILFYHHTSKGTLPVSYMALCKMVSKWGK